MMSENEDSESSASFSLTLLILLSLFSMDLKKGELELVVDVFLKREQNK